MTGARGTWVEFSPAGRGCSFCGIGATADSKYAVGLGAVICVECLNRYHEIFSSPEQTAAVQQPPWDEMSDSELLEQLPKIAAASAQVHQFLSEWVCLVRERGISWTAIGKSFGISRQAAWERFTRATQHRTTDETGS